MRKGPSFEAFDRSRLQYFSVAAVAMTVQMQNTEQFLDLYKAFLSSGLVPITVKGIICRSLYGGRGDFRPSGDEDVLIEKKDYEKATEVLNACGYQSDKQPDMALKVVQEVIFYNPNEDDSLTVELHLNPFGSDSTTRDKMSRWFKDVSQSDEVIRDTPVRTMTPTDHFLFLTFHAFYWRRVRREDDA